VHLQLSPPRHSEPSRRNSTARDIGLLSRLGRPQTCFTGPARGAMAQRPTDALGSEPPNGSGTNLQNRVA
jgi:hypothetical protein